MEPGEPITINDDKSSPFCPGEYTMKNAKRHDSRDFFIISPYAPREEYYQALISVKEMLLNIEANLDFMEKNGFTQSFSGYYDDIAHFEWIEDRLAKFFGVKSSYDD